jgi:isopenicillin N synthase-like dioxygenase
MPPNNAPHNQELKTALPCTSRDGFIRGYLPYGAESGRKEYFEPKEGFSYGYEWNPELPASNQLQGPNVWPAQRPDFKDACKAHFQSSVEICLAVVAAVAVALEKDPSVLLEYCHDGDTISLMRLFRYHPAVADRTCLGSSPHTDWGFLTLILQDHMGGLQVQRDDTWIDVPAPAPYSFVVNGGDFLALLSKGRYHSPVHRVQTPATKRLSFVFFYYPKYESDMQSQSWSSAASVADTGYNTLMQVEVDGVLPTFGSYIQRKWQGVQVAALK